MLHKLPHLSNSCREFVGQAQKINNKSSLNKVTLSHHTQLLEILEIPQLMETCVRNGFYEEALQIETFLQKLKKNFTNIKVIDDIVRNFFSINYISNFYNF